MGVDTDLSCLPTLKFAYQMGQLLGQPLTAWQGLYGLTLGNTRALSLDGHIGRLAQGMDADFVVIDPTPTPLMGRRKARNRNLGETLFALMILGDDRSVAKTFTNGRCQHRR